MRGMLGVMVLLMFACGGGKTDATGESTDTIGGSTGDATGDATETPTMGTGAPSGCACFALGAGIEELCPQPPTCDKLTAACPDDQPQILGYS